jgi:hypothetical protein
LILDCEVTRVASFACSIVAAKAKYLDDAEAALMKWAWQRRLLVTMFSCERSGSRRCGALFCCRFGMYSSRVEVGTLIVSKFSSEYSLKFHSPDVVGGVVLEADNSWSICWSTGLRA